MPLKQEIEKINFDATVTVTELSNVKYRAKSDGLNDKLKILAIFLTE